MKKFITILLILVVTLSVTACGGGNNFNSGYKKELLMGFETREELASLVMSNAEQSVKKLNTDTTYVTQGSASMFLDLHTADDYYLDYKESAVQWILGRKYASKSNYSDVVGVTFDIFNARDEEIDICVSFNNRALIIGYQTLKSGRNRVEIAFDPNELFSFSSYVVRTLDLTFDSRNERVTVYMDNLEIITREDKYNAYDFNGKSTSANMYEFNNDAEAYGILDQGGFDSIFSRFRASINRDTRYIKSGIGSLKLQFKKDRETGKICNRIRTRDGQNAPLSDYAGQDYYFVTDIYNASNKTISVTFTLWYVGNTNYSVYFGEIAPNSWSNPDTFKVAVDEVIAKGNDNVFTIMITFSGVANDDIVYVDNIKLAK